jgi:type I restriction enzyme S subunit
MNPERLLHNFDRLIDTPDAVPRLRRFILDLAVRGKLVEQNLEDEPAAELLKRLTGDTKFSQIETEELPFKIPSTWLSAKACDLINLQYGKSLVAKDRKDKGSVSVYGSNGIVGYCDTALTEEPAIIIGRKGSAGALNLCNGPSWTTDVAYYLIPPSFFNIQFLLIVLQTLDLVSLGKGVKPGLNRTDAYQLPIVLPPLAEQHRIVAKVDELMALCDELEAAQTKRERRRDRLVAATLHGLNNGETALEAKEKFPFEESARFYFSHLPRLSTRSEHIQQLRQTILNLAVRGQLVPQNPSDESVSTVDSLNVPFRLPLSWQWKSVGELGKTQTGSTPPTGERHHYNGNIPFIKPAAISNGLINYEGQGLTESGVRESSVVQAGAILMVCIGGSIGKAAVVNQKVCFNQQINSVSPREGIDTQYLFFAMQSPYFRTLVMNTAAQGTLPIISKGKWARLLIPLPPLAEQYRIVEKVAELMALCAKLETQLTTTSKTHHQLLEATLHEALAAY